MRTIHLSIFANTRPVYHAERLAGRTSNKGERGNMWNKEQGDCDENCKTCSKEQNERCLAMYAMIDEAEKKLKKIKSIASMQCARSDNKNDLSWVYNVLQELFLEQKLSLQETIVAAIDMRLSEKEEGSI